MRVLGSGGRTRRGLMRWWRGKGNERKWGMDGGGERDYNA